MFTPRKLSRAVAFGTALLGGAGLAPAQMLEEITVTAQKREQSMQDVGISVTSYSGDQMKALGVTNTVEISDQVPGLAMISFSPNLTVFNIRGVSQNNFTDNLEAPVAVYVDDVYMASMNGINAQLFDIDRVEVLRGPQGTLFGRNVTGGAVLMNTKKPGEELEATVRYTVSDSVARGPGSARSMASSGLMSVARSAR